MGSYAQFTPYRCQFCGQECDWPTETHIQCELRHVAGTVFARQLVRQYTHVDSMLYSIIRYILHPEYTQAAKRRYFLEAVFCARGSRFRIFTFYCNGLAGSISDHEDILHRIMSFI